MEYKDITQKEYLELIQANNKSLVVATFQSRNNLKECYANLEELFHSVPLKAIEESFNDNTFLKLISGDKKRLVFEDPDKKLIYGDLSGKYQTLSFKGYNFVINYVSDENLQRKNFKLYSLDISFLRGL